MHITQPRRAIRFVVMGLCILALSSSAWAQSSTWQVNALAWSPDGSMIATAGSHGIVQVRDAVTNTVILDLPGHNGAGVTGVSWSSDSRRLASAAMDKLIKIWNIGEPNLPVGQLLATLAGHERPIGTVEWSPDGAYIASRSDYGEGQNVRIWSANTFSQVGAISAGHVSEIVWSPDSTKLAISTEFGAGFAQIQNNGQLVADFPISGLIATGSVSAISWDSTSNFLAAAPFEGGYIRVFNVSTFAEVYARTAQPFIDSISWSPDGERMASFGWDSTQVTLKVWDIASNSELASYPITQPVFLNIAWSPDGQKLVYAETGDNIIVVTPPRIAVDSTEEANAAQTTQVIAAVSASPDKSLVAVGGSNGLLRIFNPDGTLRLTLDNANWYGVTAIEWKPDGRYIAVGSMDGFVRIINMRDPNYTEGQIIANLPQQSMVFDVAWGNDGYIVSISDGGSYELIIWSDTSFQAIQQVNSTSEIGILWADVEWSGTIQKYVMVGSPGIYVFTATDPSSGNFITDKLQLDSVAWSPDGSQLAVSDRETDGVHPIYILDASTGSLIKQFNGHTDVVSSLDWHPDNRIASVSADGSVRVWDVPSGQELASYPRNIDVINTSVAWMPDGSLWYGQQGTAPVIVTPPPVSPPRQTPTPAPEHTEATDTP